MAEHGVRVTTVLAGLGRTKMTEHLDLPGLLVADPEQVAMDIYSSWRRGRDLIYTPGRWRWIMLAIGTIPEKLFKKLSL